MGSIRDETIHTVCTVLMQYPVKRAALFGSLARDEETACSDADILVEFLPGTRGIEFFGLKADLEDALRRPVDLLTFHALHGSEFSFRKNVEREAVMIYEPI